ARRPGGRPAPGPRHRGRRGPRREPGGAGAADGKPPGRSVRPAVRVCSLAGDLGFGFPPESLERALRLAPHVIALQGTSADPGPYYLGAGESWYTIGGIRRDLEVLLLATIRFSDAA